MVPLLSGCRELPGGSIFILNRKRNVILAPPYGNRIISALDCLLLFSSLDEILRIGVLIGHDHGGSFKFIELNFPARSEMDSTGYSPMGLSKDTFSPPNHDIDDTSTCPLGFGMICGGETVSDSIFLHDLCKLVIAEMSSAITYDSSRGTKSGEERF
ncbi:hypothetical protein Tco_0502324 [Tanacetum coccineum]